MHNRLFAGSFFLAFVDLTESGTTSTSSAKYVIGKSFYTEIIILSRFLGGQRLDTLPGFGLEGSSHGAAGVRRWPRRHGDAFVAAILPLTHDAEAIVAHFYRSIPRIYIAYVWIAPPSVHKCLSTLPCPFEPE